MIPYYSLSVTQVQPPQMWATKRDNIKASGADIMAQLSQAVDAQGARPVLQATMLPLTPCIQSPLHANLVC